MQTEPVQTDKALAALRAGVRTGRLPAHCCCSLQQQAGTAFSGDRYTAGTAFSGNWYTAGTAFSRDWKTGRGPKEEVTPTDQEEKGRPNKRCN